MLYTEGNEGGFYTSSVVRGTMRGVSVSLTTRVPARTHTSRHHHGREHLLLNGRGSMQGHHAPPRSQTRCTPALRARFASLPRPPARLRFHSLRQASGILGEFTKRDVSPPPARTMSPDRQLVTTSNIGSMRVGGTLTIALPLTSLFPPLFSSIPLAGQATGALQGVDRPCLDRRGCPADEGQGETHGACRRHPRPRDPERVPGGSAGLL